MYTGGFGSIGGNRRTAKFQGEIDHQFCGLRSHVTGLMQLARVNMTREIGSRPALDSWWQPINFDSWGEALGHDRRAVSANQRGVAKNLIVGRPLTNEVACHAAIVERN